MLPMVMVAVLTVQRCIGCSWDNLGLLRRVPDRHAEASLSDLPIDLQMTIDAGSCQGAAAPEHHKRHISIHSADGLGGWPM